MAAHRFWRVSFTPSAAGIGTLNLSALHFRTSIGGSNAAVGGTPSTDALEVSGAVANLFDADDTTNLRFTGDASPNASVWIAYDFLTPVDVQEVYLRASNASAISVGAIIQFAHVQYSDDGLHWISLGPVASLLPLSVNSESITISNFSATTARSGMVILRLAPGWPTGPGSRSYKLRRFNEFNSGGYYISGTTKIDDTPDIPVSRLVRLYERVSGRAVAEQWSEFGTGAYRFENLKLQKYFVVSHDHTLYYNAVIKDEIAPEPMV